ncbi:unnamed protein product, partial [Mesorhabditis spiculigera]
MSLEAKDCQRLQRYLMDSSDEEQDMVMGPTGWMGKPRLENLSLIGTSQTKKPAKKVVPKKRKIIVESDDDGGQPDYTKATTLRQQHDQAVKRKKHAKKALDDEFSDEAPTFSDDENDNRKADEFSEDEFSAPEEGKPTKKRVKREHEECLMYFNSLKEEQLAEMPKITKKLSELLIANQPYQDFEQLTSKLGKERGGRVMIEGYLEELRKRGILRRILDYCNVDSTNVAKDFENVQNDVTVPNLLNKDYQLHRYQREGLNWLIMMHKKKLSCILADEMGLGKTIQIIAFCAWLKENNVKGTQMIIVPSSTIENWMAEIQKWCPSLKLLTYYGTQDERYQMRVSVKRNQTPVDILLTTYNLATKPDDRKIQKQFKINYVIYDEGHMLKNCGSQRFQQMITIQSNRKILLTGTPLQNNLIELISLMYFVMKDIFDKYCDDMKELLAHFKQQGGRVSDSSEQAMYQRDRIEQAKAILEPYVLRRIKSQVLTELPSKTEETVTIEMTDHQVMLYNFQLEDSTELQSADGVKLRELYTGLMRLRQAANHPLLTRSIYDDDECLKIAKKLRKERGYEKKQTEHIAQDLTCLSDFQIHHICAKFTSTAEFLLDDQLSLCSGKCAYLDKELTRIKELGEKVLVFSQFTEMLDILETYMEVKGHSFLRLDGQTPVLDRQDLINEFNEDPSIFVFLLSTRAGGLGINLTAANHIIIHDIDFNPYNDKQAEDRCHRLGQKKPVHVVRLVSKDTVEEGMERLAKRKLELEREVTVATRGAAQATSSSTADGTEGHSEEEEDANELRQIMALATKIPRSQNI